MEVSHKPLAIIQMGHPPEDIRNSQGEQPDWVKAALAGSARPLSVVNPYRDEPLPDPSTIAGAVLTGSWSMVTDREDWSERTAEWLRTAMQAGLPLLGICYGHQLMAHAFGGVVDFHPKGREIGQHNIELLPLAEHDGLLKALPPRFHANLTHEQSVLIPPKNAVVLARSEHDPHQILRYGPHALSVQFHPEFTVPLMAACLARRTDVFSAEGFDVDGMLNALAPTDHARQLLRDFAGQLA